MLKQLNWYDVFEIEKIKIKNEDLEVVKNHFDKEVPLFYDENNRIYNEAGIYIADIEAIED